MVMLAYHPPAHVGLDILFEDAYLLIVNKPAGLLSVPGRGTDKQDCLISRVQITHPSALIVHRLDMATSGILILALDKETHRLLSQQFQQRAIQKHYVAILKGLLSPEQGMIDMPMICDWPNRPKQMIDRVQGKPAQTYYKVLTHTMDNQRSCVLLKPITGRTHQLRLHCQQLGHPILGDELYGDEEARTASPRLLLHASMISFEHVQTGKQVEIVSEVPF